MTETPITDTDTTDEPIHHITTYLDEEPIAYTNHTEFLVQVGRGRGAYKTRYGFKGDLRAAVQHYNCINVGNGRKKRLIAPSLNKPVLARRSS